VSVAAVSIPEWLRRGRAPHGQIMTAGERRTLRAMLTTATDDRWCGKSRELLATLANLNARTISRHILRFLGWGILITEGRIINGALRVGWLLQLDVIRPVAREKTVDLAEHKALQRALIELAALRRRNRELERIVATIHQPAALGLAPDIRVQEFARGLGAERVHFLELTAERRIDGTPQRLYGDPAKLQVLVDLGHAKAVRSEPLWPTDVPRGPAPLDASNATLRGLGALMDRESEDKIRSTLWWYRADLHENPGQILWWRGLTAAPKPDGSSVFSTAVDIAHGARERHERRYKILLETHARREAPQPSVLLTSEPDRVMSEEVANNNRRELLAAVGLDVGGEPFSAQRRSTPS